MTGAVNSARACKAYLELGRGIAGVRFCSWPGSDGDLGMALDVADLKV